MLYWLGRQFDGGINTCSLKTEQNKQYVKQIHFLVMKQNFKKENPVFFFKQLLKHCFLSINEQAKIFIEETVSFLFKHLL